MPDRSAPSPWLFYRAVPLPALAPNTCWDLVLGWRFARVPPGDIHDLAEQMNDTQYKALRAFIASMDGDLVAQEELKAYGNAYSHLIDYVVDQTVDQLSLSPRDLHPAK